MDVLAKYKNGERINSSELSGLTEAELLELKAHIDEDLFFIGDQLFQAKQKVVTSGEYADASWYRRATFAKRIKGQLSQKVQNELGKRRRERRDAPVRLSEHEAFIKALLKVMDDFVLPVEKTEIIAKAKVVQQKILAGEPY